LGKKNIFSLIFHNHHLYIHKNSILEEKDLSYENHEDVLERI